MRLSTIIAELDKSNETTFTQDYDPVVKGVSHDSRKVKPGEIFVALTGQNFDGHKYIKNAVEQGAIAIVGEREITDGSLPYIQVRNSRYALAKIAAAYHGYPAKSLNVIGVTGTDGKTTTVNLIHHILTQCGINAGMVSTVNARIGEESVDTGYHVTTPEAQEIQSIMRMMVDSGLSHVVLEATSHGLEQFRVAECYFDVAVVTNITHEHLDYHGTYDKYLLSKSRLFTSLEHGEPKTIFSNPISILNKDDISFQPLKKRINKKIKKDIKIISYGTSQDCDVIARDIKNMPKGLSFSVEIKGESTFRINTKLIGEYNVSNILAAISVACFACKIALPDISNAINSFSGVPGRMEIIDMGQPFTAIVDFAHTPNALKVALTTSRNRCGNKVIAVFGSAGLRDREKRRLMAATSVQNADVTIITAEDPRTEKLDDILSEMKDEAQKSGGIVGENVFIIADRGKAIREAVLMASDGDLVIVCGKGHEQSMCFGTTEYPWDDRIALKSSLADLLDVDGPKMPYLPTQE